ncbi:MAG: thymidine phosphorylase [bacterium]|nr:thymidine phosphorylase [bacterium]MDY2830439.1 thymidine phosphorylase [Alphaproteobacteria bacterium]
MLSLKHIAVNSFNENIVYLHKDCNAYKLDDIKNLTKVEVHGGSAPLFAFLEIVNDPDFVSPDELGLNTEAFTALNLPEGANVNISLAGFPPSLSSVQRKVAGNILSSSEYSSIIRDITDKRYSNMDISSFLVASGSFMTASEVLSLTEALVGDDVIRWDDENIVVDHHCLGGVPGNKTDIIITAIVAAYGLPIPKTASRSLTSCAGVADTFSVLANVDISEDKLHQLIKEHRGAIADYNTLPIAPASKIIASVERAIGITQQQHIVAEILAIKLATGITHLVLDIPVGSTSRIKSTNEAMRIRKLVEYIGDMLSIEIDAVITDGSEPIGNGIGAVLEARDVMKILRNKEDAPQDLLEKSLFLAGRILEFDPKLRGGQGYHVAKEILTSGRALETLSRIIYAQGKAPQAQLGHLTRDIISAKSGVVESIDNKRINKIGILAGASQYPGAGLDLLKKVGDVVESGEPLYRIHSVTSSDFAFANSFVDGDNGYEISSKR